MGTAALEDTAGENVFVRDRDVSPVYTKWFPTFVWFGTDEDGAWIFFRYVLARLIVYTGTRFMTGQTAYETVRELRDLTPENVTFSGWSATEEVIDYSCTPLKFRENAE